jgi:uroporphyrinogen III methyltransferase/synthase
MSEPERVARPLSGRRILVTRSPEQAGDFAALLRDQGAEGLQVSLIRFSPPDSWEPADRAIDRMGCYSLVLFTSANAVKFFLRRFQARGADPRALSGCTLAAIGPKTARVLEDQGLPVSVVPEEFVAEGLLASMKERGVKGKEILIPRAQEARAVLVDGLEGLGAKVTVAPVYRTVPAEENREALLLALRSGVDMVTFTSSSTVRYFLELLGPEGVALARGVRIACIGRITAETARSRGLPPDVVSEKSAIPDFAAAIVRYFSPPAQR